MDAGVSAGRHDESSGKRDAKAVAFYKKILDQEGIENRVFEYAPGRGDLWARLPHTHGRAGESVRIILLNHMDVVTSDASHWRVPPFSGEIKDGYIWGRGAQDMKDEGLAQLVVMVMLKREKVALDRDVIFLAVADEEADGTRDGLVHRASERSAGERGIPDQRRRRESAGERQGEVRGRGRGREDDVLAARGGAWPAGAWVEAESGFGARTGLVRALDRIIAYRTPLRVLPVVDEFLRDMAPYEPPERAAYYRNVREGDRGQEISGPSRDGRVAELSAARHDFVDHDGRVGADERDSAGGVGESGCADIAGRRSESRAGSRAGEW